MIVIGGGAAGENIAGRCTDCGASIAVVEAELLGGECSYWACMPSKALLRPGEALAEARRVPGAAAAVTGELDVAAVLARRDDIAAHWDDEGQVQWLEGAGGVLVRGRGRLVGERRVDVELPDGRVRAARGAPGGGAGDRFVGARCPRSTACATSAPGTAATPPARRRSPSGCWCSAAASSGVEMAQAWKRLGAREVTVIDNSAAPGAPSSSRSRATSCAPRSRTRASRWCSTRRSSAHAGTSRAADDGAGHAHARRRPHVHRRRAARRHRSSPNTDDLGLDTVGLSRASRSRSTTSLRAIGRRR